MTTELMGTAEIAELLGVTRQRIDQIAREDSTFPSAEATLQSVRIWSRETVERWARATGRLPAQVEDPEMAAGITAASKSAVRNKTCFLIGPIGNKFAPHGSTLRETYEEALGVWEEVVRPACEAVGLDPVRADGLAKAGEITEQIFRRLLTDDVVIADLTGANPNVMYELGLRHTRNLLTIQIGEFGRLPFDINTIRTVMFSRSAHGLVQARRDLVEVLTLGLLDQYDAVTATRVWNELPATALPDAPKVQEAETPPADEPGFVDTVVAGEVSLNLIASILASIGEETTGLGGLAEEATNAMSKSDARGAGMAGRLNVLTKFAGQLEAMAPRLKEKVDHYTSEMNRVDLMILALISQLEQSPTQLEDEGVLKGATTIRAFASVSREALEKMSGMVASMRANAKLARVVREPTRRVAGELDRFQEATAVTDEWDRRLQALGVPSPVGLPELPTD